MNVILTPTITHTGTRFLHRSIFHSPVQFCVCNPNRGPKNKQRVIWHTHMFSQLKHVHEMYLESGYPIVIPLVHPARNLRSCIKRSRAPSQYAEQWENMIAFVERCNPMFLHLDSDQREVQAQAIAVRFGLSLEIDWSASNATGATHGSHTADIEKYLADTPNEFIEFYNQTLKQEK